MASKPLYRGFIDGTHRYRLRVWDGTRQVSQEFRVGGGKRRADQAAGDELSKLVRRIARNPGVSYDRTLDDLWDAFLANAEATDRYSPTTLKDHLATMKTTIIPAFGKYKLRDLTSYQLDAFYMRESSTHSARTVLKYHRLLSTVFRQAEKWGWVEVSPTRNATPPPVRRIEIKPPTTDTIRLLLAVCDDDLTGLLVLLAASLGARRGELMGLRWDDINHKAGTVTIQRSVYEKTGGGVGIKPTKTDRPRTIALDKGSQDALRRLSVGRRGYVFSNDGEYPWRPTRATRAYLNLRALVPKAAGVRLHDFRHYHATQLFDKGFDPVTVSKRLGHADSHTTMLIYAHALSERDRAAADAIGGLLSG